MKEGIADLPVELVAELSRNYRGDPLLTVMDEYGGIASLDRLLIDLYRKYRKISKRTVISNRLYRMAKAGLVRRVGPSRGRKGIYELTDAGKAAVVLVCTGGKS